VSALEAMIKRSAPRWTIGDLPDVDPKVIFETFQVQRRPQLLASFSDSQTVGSIEDPLPNRRSRRSMRV
jgi:hypothetical protein